MAGENHFSRAHIAADLMQPTRDSSGAGRPSSLLGLAPDGVFRATSVTGSPVRSYRTLSPLPVLPRGSHRRFAFCGTFHRLSPPGDYPAPCPVELGLSSNERCFQVRWRSSLARSPLPRPHEGRPREARKCIQQSGGGPYPVSLDPGGLRHCGGRSPTGKARHCSRELRPCPHRMNTETDPPLLGISNNEEFAADPSRPRRRR